MINTVVFDFDGTLVESNQIKFQTFFDATEHLPGAKKLLEKVLAIPDFGDRYAVFEYISVQISKQDRCVDISSDDLVNRYTSLCEKRISDAEEISGASFALDQLKEKQFNLAISSVTPESTLKKILAMRGMSHYFRDVYGAPTSKEQHLQSIMTNNQCHADQVVMVGDSDVDRRAAENMNCYFVGIGEDDERFNIRPDILLNNLNELPEVIATLKTN